jgi:hypothetical protein
MPRPLETASKELERLQKLPPYLPDAKLSKRENLVKNMFYLAGESERASEEDCSETLKSIIKLLAIASHPDRPRLEHSMITIARNKIELLQKIITRFQRPLVADIGDTYYARKAEEDIQHGFLGAKDPELLRLREEPDLLRIREEFRRKQSQKPEPAGAGSGVGAPGDEEKKPDEEYKFSFSRKVDPEDLRNIGRELRREAERKEDLDSPKPSPFGFDTFLTPSQVREALRERPSPVPQPKGGAQLAKGPAQLNRDPFSR